jgi:hypothetical protein
MGSPRGVERKQMTAKRDLKRRVRERAARTGESYVTARRHVVQADDAPAAALAPAPAKSAPAMEVVELLDLTADAAQLGLRCRVFMPPSIAAAADPAVVLARLRDVLVGTEGDPLTARLRAVALAGKPSPAPSARRPDLTALRRFFQRARAGLGGVSDDGSALALPIAGKTGMVPVVCSIWHQQPALMPSTFNAEVFGNELWDRAALRGLEAIAPVVPATGELFVEHRGMRHAIAYTPFLIGRAPACDLVIAHAGVASTHASIIRRGGDFFIKDLGSESGLHYRGMRIDNKRIDDGDVFELVPVVGQRLRFTYRGTE